MITEGYHMFVNLLGQVREIQSQFNFNKRCFQNPLKSGSLLSLSGASCWCCSNYEYFMINVRVDPSPQHHWQWAGVASETQRKSTKVSLNEAHHCSLQLFDLSYKLSGESRPGLRLQCVSTQYQAEDVGGGDTASCRHLCAAPSQSDLSSAELRRKVETTWSKQASIFSFTLSWHSPDSSWPQHCHMLTKSSLKTNWDMFQRTSRLHIAKSITYLPEKTQFYLRKWGHICRFTTPISRDVAPLKKGLKHGLVWPLISFYCLQTKTTNAVSVKI